MWVMIFIIMFGVYTYTFKDDFEEKDIGVTTVSLLIIFALYVVMAII